MFDFNSILDLLKVEPGHGLVQSVILLGIWLQARGVKQEISKLASSLDRVRLDTDEKIHQHEIRLTKLEHIGDTK